MLGHLGQKDRKLMLCASLGRRGQGARVVGLLGGVWPADELFDVVNVDGITSGYQNLRCNTSFQCTIARGTFRA
jgi:hypothetical protein